MRVFFFLELITRNIFILLKRIPLKHIGLHTKVGDACTRKPLFLDFEDQTIFDCRSLVEGLLEKFPIISGGS